MDNYDLDNLEWWALNEASQPGAIPEIDDVLQLIKDYRRLKSAMFELEDEDD